MRNKTELICPYCPPMMDNLPLNNGTVNYSMLEMNIIGRGTVLRVRNLKPDGLFDGQDMVLINYCPICGRDLENKLRRYTEEKHFKHDNV